MLASHGVITRMKDVLAVASASIVPAWMDWLPLVVTGVATARRPAYHHQVLAYQITLSQINLVLTWAPLGASEASGNIQTQPVSTGANLVAAAAKALVSSNLRLFCMGSLMALTGSHVVSRPLQS